jgi:ketosteroid isomerase-like protein
MLRSIPAFLALGAFVLVFAAAAEQGDDWTSLVDAEKAFARAAIDNGIRSAFLANLAGGALIFRPQPTPGRPYYEALSPDLPTRLVWKPAFAEVSAAGDLGYTTGPYAIYKDKAARKASGFGDYVTVWKRPAGGAWKAVLDIGVSHAAPKPSGDAVQAPSEASVAHGPGLSGFALEQEKQKLRKEEAAFARLSSVEGTAKAYEAWASERVRLYREGNVPAVGLKAARKLLTRAASPSSWSAEGADLSASNDLGYTYGTGSLFVAAGQERLFSFVQIWRRDSDNRWRVVLDIAIPYPSR